MPKVVFALLLLVSVTFAHPVQAQTPVGDCKLPTRLQIGTLGSVIPGGQPNNLRQEATTSSTLSGQIPPGASFAVVEGPICADKYVWWHVRYADKSGWTAEGDPTDQTYWLQPLVQNLATVESNGCLQPPEDYTRVQIGYATFNARTLAMLDYSQALYSAQGGTLDFHQAITQGSYAGGIEAASFGTHDGGGAVDLSVRSLVDFSILEDEIEPMIHALRTAGFAAWLREENELYPGSPIHIHAIAIGDAELSEAARAQIDGAFGYLRGYDGLPRDDGIPQPDRSGEPIICAWMIELGLSDLRAG